jgi:hypothetical protein
LNFRPKIIFLSFSFISKIIIFSSLPKKVTTSKLILKKVFFSHQFFFDEKSFFFLEFFVLSSNKQSTEQNHLSTSWFLFRVSFISSCPFLRKCFELIFFFFVNVSKIMSFSLADRQNFTLTFYDDFPFVWSSHFSPNIQLSRQHLLD